MKLVKAVAVATTLLCAGQVQAHEEEIGKPFHHYDVAQPATSQEAVDWLNTRSATMAKSFEKKDFEGIHEQSYYLEVSVEKLRKQLAEIEKALDGVDEQVQAIHFASENAEEDILKQHLPQLQKDSAALQKLLQLKQETF